MLLALAARSVVLLFAIRGCDSKGRNFDALRCHLQVCWHNGNQRGLHIDSAWLHRTHAHVSACLSTLES